MSLSVGDRLGPYEIVSKIGAGGMGEVFKARDTRLDRTVALKVSKAQFSERFEREARAIAQLNHPHICQLYDVGPNFLVMEFVEGVPLKGPLPVDKAIEYAGQILDALDAAHQKTITHRDLKPANIMVTKQGIKLLDFGLAKFETGPLRNSDETVTEALTQQGQILGTLQYMAPEQLQAQPTDARSDLFSFGCVFYEMLSGKRAFDGTSAASLIAAILEREPKPLSTAPPLDRVIRRAMAKDPDHRFQTARDLKAALLWAHEQPGASSTAAVAPAPPSRNWIWPAVATLVLGAALGWGVQLFQRSAVEARPSSFELNPPENGRFAFGVNVGGIAVSPDGRNVTFVANVKGKTALWVRALDSSTPKMLLGTEDAAHPFWSPDGKSIAYFAAGKIQRIDLVGGSPVTLYKGITQYGGAWTADGTIIFNTFGGGLFRLSSAGGMPSPLTTLDASRAENAHYWPQVLPGGKFLYWARSNSLESSAIYGASLAKPAEAVRILNTNGGALYAPGPDGKGYLLWLRGDTLMAQPLDVSTLQLTGEPRQVAPLVGVTSPANEIHAAVSSNGVLLMDQSIAIQQFYWYNREGKILASAGDAAPPYFTFRLSPDGRRLAVQRGQNLWITELERGISSPVVSTRSGFAAWSADGRKVAFRNGTPFNLFVKEANSSGVEQRLTESPNQQYAEDWSRDGRFLLFRETDLNGDDLWILPMTPDGKAADKPRPYLKTPANEAWARFSPELNPQWVLYQSSESGRSEVYVDAFPEPRAKVQISTGGGDMPVWGHRANELFYVSADNKLMAVSLKLGANSVEPSPPRELFTLPLVDSQVPYDIAPDGRILVLGQQGASHPLTLVLNWTALLK